MKKNGVLNTVITLSNTYIEWIEYAFFLYFSPVIGRLFFPQHAPTTSLMMTYSLLTISYLCRPLAGLAFGYASDKYGRKPPLVFAMVLMAVATLGIGCLPTYASIGIFAPLILLLLRMLQSIAVSGELQSTSVYLIEHSQRYTILAGSLAFSAASGGMFMGGLISSQLTDHPEVAELWRYPFIITGLLSVTLSFLRVRLLETPFFTLMQRRDKVLKNPIQELVNYPGAFLRIILISSFICAFVYLCNGFYAHYLARVAMPLSQAQFVCSIAELAVFLCAPILACCLNKHNYLITLILGLVGFIVVAPFQFYAASQGDTHLIFFALGLYALCDTLITSSVGYYLFLQLPANLCCTGLGFAWNLSAACMGGGGTILASILVEHGYNIVPGYLISILALAALWSTLRWISRNQDIIENRMSQSPHFPN